MNLQKKSILFFNGLTLLVCILLGLLGYISANNGFEVALEDKANADMRQSKAFLDLKYEGDWTIKNDTLYKGDKKIDDDFALVDEMGTLTGNNVTIFKNDTRVATTFQSGGKRSTGTKASEAVIKEVLVDGNDFKGEAEVLGDKYFCVYSPIKDSSGKNIGMLFMGIPKAEISELQTSFIRSIVIVIALVLIVVSVLIYFAIHYTIAPLQHVKSAMHRIADGNLSGEPLPVKGSDEISDIADSANHMQESVKKILQEIVTASQKVAAAGEELTSSASQTAESIHQVADNIVEMAENTEKQSDSLGEINEQTRDLNQEMSELRHSSEEMRKVAETTLNGAKEGHSAVSNAMDAMSKMASRMESSSKVVTNLGERSKEVGKIIDTISGIAEQTNLLALNAAIEAARAGEHGRGFAVVSEEVRKLAEQSGSAAQNISNIISGIQSDTMLAVEAMEKGNEEVKAGTHIVRETGEVFSKIEKLVDNLYSQISLSQEKIGNADQGSKTIADTVQTVSEFGRTVAGDAQTVSATTEEQTAMMHNITDASHELVELAQSLHDKVSKFKF